MWYTYSMAIKYSGIINLLIPGPDTWQVENEFALLRVPSLLSSNSLLSSPTRTGANTAGITLLGQVTIHRSPHGPAAQSRKCQGEDRGVNSENIHPFPFTSPSSFYFHLSFSPNHEVRAFILDLSY